MTLLKRRALIGFSGKNLLPTTFQYVIRAQYIDIIICLVYWGLMPQQQPGSSQGGEMMMMKSVSWWRKPEYPEETTDLRQVPDETFHTYGLCPVRGLNLGCSGVILLYVFQPLVIYNYIIIQCRWPWQ